MDKLQITGGIPLSGDVIIGGAKNSILPTIAASLLTSDRLVLENISKRIRDVMTIIQLLQSFGIHAQWEDPKTLVLQANDITQFEAPYEMVKTMRASVLVLGPMLARFGKAVVSLP